MGTDYKLQDFHVSIGGASPPSPDLTHACELAVLGMNPTIPLRGTL